MKVVKIGFTGSREGLSVFQEQHLLHWLYNYTMSKDSYEFHHGGCIGADFQAHMMAKRLGLKVYVHPCDIPRMQARIYDADFMYPAKPPLDRNKDIVDATDILVAAPLSEEIVRSGTWSTVRYARMKNREMMIIFREGVGERNEYDDTC